MTEFEHGALLGSTTAFLCAFFNYREDFILYFLGWGDSLAPAARANEVVDEVHDF